uniref:Uncharacterized protein n=1 Tax=Panagrolaimus sp. JU765 TaxID=591449 RepID=A0AC34QZF1_9BILA
MKVIFVVLIFVSATFHQIQSEDCTKIGTCTTEPTGPAMIPYCGEWSAWSCDCCGGCFSARCIRDCQSNDKSCSTPYCKGERVREEPNQSSRCIRECQSNDKSCSTPYCKGERVREEPNQSCSSPSPSCQFPLAICCDGNYAYVNGTRRYCGEI